MYYLEMVSVMFKNSRKWILGGHFLHPLYNAYFPKRGSINVYFNKHYSCSMYLITLVYPLMSLSGFLYHTYHFLIIIILGRSMICIFSTEDYTNYNHIVGGSVAGTILLVILILVTVFLIHRRYACTCKISKTFHNLIQNSRNRIYHAMKIIFSTRDNCVFV